MTTQFRVAAHEPNGARRGAIPTPSSFNFASPLNEVSSAAIEVRPSSINAEMMLSFVELAVEASYDNGATWNEIPNGRYISKERNYELVGPFNVRKYTLNGYGWQLNKALQWDTTNLNADGKRPFLSANVGTILKTLIDEAQVRGTIPGLTYTFDTSLDTDGAAWDKIITIYYEPGLSIYSILDNLAQQGMCDWRFQGRELQVYNADTVMAVTREANLKLGVDVKALPIKASIADLIDKAIVIGDGGTTVELENLTVTLPWGHWEGSISNGGVSDAGTMTLLGQTLLDDNGHEKIQYTCEMKGDTTTYFPFQDFVPGEYVTAPTETVGTSQPFRVRQINGRMDGNGKTNIDLVVNDRFVERELRNAKKTNGIVGGATAGGSGGQPAPPPTEGDTREPKQVLGLVTSSGTYLDAQGAPQAVAFLDWDAVTQATNDTAMDIQNYAVEVRDNEEGNPDWKVLTYSEADSTSYSPFRVGGNYDFRISAVGKNGIWGAASAISNLVMAVDSTPPPVPSTPTGDGSLGVISLNWDGLSDIAGGMGSDFSHIEVAFGNTATPTDVINHMFASGTVQVDKSLAPLSTDRYARFRSVDTSGNVSAWGAALGPIQALPVADTDLSDTVNDAIDEALNGEVDGSRLAPWTIGPDRLIIGVGEQALANPGFESGDTSQWLPADSLTFAAVLTPRSGDYAGRVTMSDSVGLQTATHGTSSLSDHLQNMAVAVDDIIYGSVWLQMEAGTANANVTLRVYDAAGGIISFEVGNSATIPTGSWQKFEAEGTIFSTDASYAVLSVEVDNTSGAAILIDDGILRQKMQGHLIVDGTVTAGKIAADAITADKIAANAVTAASISAGAIDGKLITGATIRTDASTTRLEMDSDSFTAYSSGNVQFEVTPSSVFSFGARLGTIDTGEVELGPGASGYGDTFEARGTLRENWLHLEQYDTGDTQVNATYDIGGTGSTGTGVPTNAIIEMTSRNASGVTTDGAGMELRGNGLNNRPALRLSGAGPSYEGGGTHTAGAAPVIDLGIGSGAWTPTSGNGPVVGINAQEVRWNTGTRMNWTWQDLDITMGDEVNFISASPDAVVDQLARDSSMLHIEPEGVFIATGTTGNSANLWTASNGAIRRTTSALRYKQDIEDMDIDPLTILKLRPRTWRDKQEVREDPNTTHRLPGFIAEEVHDAGLGLFVVYDRENNPDALSYDRVSAAHQLVLKWFNDRLSALEEKLT